MAGKGKDTDTASITSGEPGMAGQMTPTQSVTTVKLDQDQAIKVKEPDLFYGEKKKFKSFRTQCRMYIWADKKKKNPTFIYGLDQTMWISSYLRGDAYTRFEPYTQNYFDNAMTWTDMDEPAKTIMRSADNFFDAMAQAYGDLDEERTNELALQSLKQTGTVPEYLTRFAQYAAGVKWDTRAQMAQFYKGLKSNVKDAMAVNNFPSDWDSLVAVANRLDDNFRRREQEKKGDNRVKGSAPKKDPDAMDWQHSATFKKGKQHQKKGKGKGPKEKKKGKCYNCGKEGHFAADCYSKKNSTTTPKPKEEAKKPKPKDKGKEKATTNAMTRTQQWVNKEDLPSGRQGVKFSMMNRGGRQDRRGWNTRQPVGRTRGQAATERGVWHPARGARDGTTPDVAFTDPEHPFYQWRTQRRMALEREFPDTGPHHPHLAHTWTAEMGQSAYQRQRAGQGLSLDREVAHDRALDQQQAERDQLVENIRRRTGEDIYAHLSPTLQQQENEGLDRMFRQSPNNNASQEDLALDGSTEAGTPPPEYHAAPPPRRRITRGAQTNGHEECSNLAHQGLWQEVGELRIQMSEERARNESLREILMQLQEILAGAQEVTDRLREHAQDLRQALEATNQGLQEQDRLYNQTAVEIQHSRTRNEPITGCQTCGENNDCEYQYDFNTADGRMVAMRHFLGPQWRQTTDRSFAEATQALARVRVSEQALPELDNGQAEDA
jgi:hypothetical protein